MTFFCRETWKRVRKDRAEFAYIIIIFKTQSASQTNENSSTLISPTHLCYKLSQHIGIALGVKIPMGKETQKKKKIEPECGNGAHWMDRVSEARTKRMYKPNGHLSSLGTKMFQSQNLSCRLPGLQRKE